MALDSTDKDGYRTTIRALSDRIVRAQAPIFVLDAIKWGDEIRDRFFRAKCCELPAVDMEFYRERQTLSFSAEEKKAELHTIERDVVRLLGQLNPLGQIMRRICREYAMVVRMLEARGTAEFTRISQPLYGSSTDVFHAGDPTVADLATLLEEILQGLLEEGVLAPPCYVPTHFTDLKGMTAWMSLSRFLNTLSFDKLEADYAGII